MQHDLAWSTRRTSSRSQLWLGRAPEQCCGKGKRCGYRCEQFTPLFPGDPEGLFRQTQRKWAWGSAPLSLPMVSAKQPLCVPDFYDSSSQSLRGWREETLARWREAAVQRSLTVLAVRRSPAWQRRQLCCVASRCAARRRGPVSPFSRSAQWRSLLL